jgi:hypothetical protein
MGAFEYRQALEIRDTFSRRGVRYLFIGKSGAILLGYPDTTQDADLFLDKQGRRKPGEGSRESPTPSRVSRVLGGPASIGRVGASRPERGFRRGSSWWRP